MINMFLIVGRRLLSKLLALVGGVSALMAIGMLGRRRRDEAILQPSLPSDDEMGNVRQDMNIRVREEIKMPGPRVNNTHVITRSPRFLPILGGAIAAVLLLAIGASFFTTQGEFAENRQLLGTAVGKIEDVPNIATIEHVVQDGIGKAIEMTVVPQLVSQQELDTVIRSLTRQAMADAITSTPTPTMTPSATPTSKPPATLTPTPSRTQTPIGTATETVHPTRTPSSTPTDVVVTFMSTRENCATPTPQVIAQELPVTSGTEPEQLPITGSTLELQEDQRVMPDCTPTSQTPSDRNITIEIPELEPLVVQQQVVLTPTPSPPQTTVLTLRYGGQPVLQMRVTASPLQQSEVVAEFTCYSNRCEIEFDNPDFGTIGLNAGENWNTVLTGRSPWRFRARFNGSQWWTFNVS